MGDPLIVALVNHLPPTDMEWGDDNRARWLRAMAAAIALVYSKGGSDDGDALLARAAGDGLSLCLPVARAVVPYGGETIRAVILHEKAGTLTAYVAHGLERDIAAQGTTVEQAYRRLIAVAEFDNITRLELGIEVPASPPSIFAMYDKAPEITP